ncbi:MAG: phage portal protein, partial [Vicinamibacterales bacterium]
LADSDLPQKLGGFFGGGSIIGKTVNDTTSMKVTAFFAGVRLLAETMGAMPSWIYERQSGGNAEPVDHPLAEVLIHQPNADMNGIEYREASASNLAARGNAYSIIERRGDGNVLSLYPVASALCETRRNKDGEIRHWITDRGKPEEYPPEKIWHRRGFSFDGLVGLSPIQCAREALSLAMAGEEFNARLFGQGLMPSARVSIPQWLSPEQRPIAERKLMEMNAGLVNMGKPMLLEGGMKVESGLITPDDAQFLQLRQLTVIEICRILGIKPHMIAALERATDNNIEKLSLEFVTYTMLPYIRRDEQAARQLFKPGDRTKYFYRYNFEGLLRADSAARAGLYSILLQNGVYSRNEVRALENRNRSDAAGMDDYTVQLNMGLIQAMEKMQEANAPKEQRLEAMFAKSLEREPTIIKLGDTHITMPAQKAGDVHVAPAQVSVGDTIVNLPETKSGDVTVNVPEREIHFEAVMPEIKVQPAQIVVQQPRETVETIERDENQEIKRITRRAGD